MSEGEWAFASIQRDVLEALKELDWHETRMALRAMRQASGNQVIS